MPPLTRTRLSGGEGAAEDHLPLGQKISEKRKASVLRGMETMSSAFPDTEPASLGCTTARHLRSEAEAYTQMGPGEFYITLEEAAVDPTPAQAAMFAEGEKNGQFPIGSMQDTAYYATLHEWGHGLDHLLNNGIIGMQMAPRAKRTP